MPISLHSHSGQFCKHATGNLQDVIKTAIQKGFISYGLSEHMPRNRSIDLYPEEVRKNSSDICSRFTFNYITVFLNPSSYIYDFWISCSAIWV